MKKLIYLSILVLPLMVRATESEKPNGWQFYSFFGNYSNRPLSSNCNPLFYGSTFIGFKYSKEIVSIFVKSDFSTAGQRHEYLRNSYSPRRDCYECDPDAWDRQTLGGDGVTHASFHSEGQEPYYARTWSWNIEIIRRPNKDILLQWGDCLIELRLKE